MNVPIIRLEVEHMKYSIRTALLEHKAKMDADIQTALDAYCNSDNLSRIINETVVSCINEAVKEEIRSMFSDSEPGRAAIREAVKKYMDDYWGELK